MACTDLNKDPHMPAELVETEKAALRHLFAKTDLNEPEFEATEVGSAVSFSQSNATT